MPASARAATSASRLLQIRAAKARESGTGVAHGLPFRASATSAAWPDRWNERQRACYAPTIEPHVGVTARLLEESPGHQRRDHGITEGGIETPQPLDLPLCQLQTWHFAYSARTSRAQSEIVASVCMWVPSRTMVKSNVWSSTIGGASNRRTKR